MKRKTQKEYLENARKVHSGYLQKLRKNPTESEARFKEFLEFIGLQHTFQKGFYKPFHRIVDFYIHEGFIKGRMPIAFEIDGGYHDHEKDLVKDSYFFKERGIFVLRFKNEEVLSGQFSERFYIIAEKNFRNKVFKRIKDKIFLYRLYYWNEPFNNYA